MVSHATVIQSKDPEEDAETLFKLFPDQFQLESSTNASVVLEGKDSCLILLHLRKVNGETVPLIIPEAQIEAAQRNCSDLETVSVKSRLGDTTLSLLRLKGGSSVLLAPPSLISSRHGRVLLTRALMNSSDEFEQEEEQHVLGSGSSSESDLIDISVEPESPENDEPTNGNAIMEEREYPLAKFPTLAVSVLEKNNQIVTGFPINSQDAIPVESDLFVGKLLMLVKPLRPEDDPYWNERLFSKKKRRFVLQLQGKLKRVPQGTLFAGGEISDQMKLGLVSKGICGLILKFIKSIAPDTHYSFGDKNDDEKPHIVVPAWTFFENIVVTKPGEEPPEMGEEFVESKESVTARKNGKSKANWNTEDTYSMSFFTMYLDLAKWQVVSIPLTNDIDLKTFWGNSFLRIALFENTTPEKDGRHLVKDNTYYFAVELRHLGMKPREDETEEEPVPMPWDRPRSGSIRLLKDTGRQESGSFLAETYGDDDVFFDAEEENSLHEVIDAESFHPSRVSQTRPAVNILSTIDSVCPAMVEVCHRGKYVKTYAFNVTKKGKTIFRTESSVEEYFATSSAKQATENMWSPRLSSSERCRRVLGQTISQALVDASASGVARVNKFAEMKAPYSSAFLLHAQPPSWTSKHNKQNIRKSGYGARAMSDRHWMEEWIQITDEHILFHHPDRHKAHFRVSLQSVVEAKVLASVDAPLMSPFSFIAIGTLGRTVYIMFPSGDESQDWVDLISGLIAMQHATDVSTSIDSSKSTDSEHSLSFDSPADEFLQESSMWHCKQRRILNGRTFSFKTCVSENIDPANVVADSLVRAVDQATDYDERGMIAFLDSVATLKDVDVYSLDEMERLAFFLNLYHTMIQHAFLVLGPPDSSFKWISYFNAIAYQCSDDIFSLTELEHCIIRAAMNYPSQFVSKFVIPKTKYAFALTRADYRINFALNCGSLSNPPLIQVYEAGQLDEQLEEASRWYMRYAAETRKSTRRALGVTLTLPKICQWFADDFGNGSTNDIVCCIERFLDDQQQKLVFSCFRKQENRFDFGELNVKYASYNFECRNLKLAA